MKTYEQVNKLPIGSNLSLNGALGAVIIRRTPKGAIVSTDSSNLFVHENDFTMAFGNLNSIGLHSIEYATACPYHA